MNATRRSLNSMQRALGSRSPSRLLSSVTADDVGSRLGSSPMSPEDGASYQRRRGRLRGTGCRQAAGDGRARCPPPLLLRRARGGRALDASRGEAAFVFEFGGQTPSRSCSRRLGTKSWMIARAVLEGASGIRPLRRRRLRHRCGDPQRPLLRGRAAARRERVLRHRRLGGGTRTRRARRSASLLEGWRSAPAATPAATWGGGESPSLPGEMLLAERRDRVAGGRRRRRAARGSRADPRRAAAGGR